LTRQLRLPDLSKRESKHWKRKPNKRKPRQEQDKEKLHLKKFEELNKRLRRHVMKLRRSEH